MLSGTQLQKWTVQDGNVEKVLAIMTFLDPVSYTDTEFNYEKILEIDSNWLTCCLHKKVLALFIMIPALQIIVFVLIFVNTPKCMNDKGFYLSQTLFETCLFVLSRFLACLFYLQNHNISSLRSQNRVSQFL